MLSQYYWMVEERREVVIEGTAHAVLRTVTTPGARVGVVGLGVSGIAAAQFLVRHGARPICLERRDEETFWRGSCLGSELAAVREAGGEVYWGVDGEAVASFVEGLAGVVLSPGVSLNGPTAAVFMRHRVPVVGEFELGIEASGVPATVVTGSNGKSTTVSLIHAAWCEAGVRSFLCGNVGTPVVAAIGDGKRFDILVAEASSYQLESCTVICPEVGVFLNLSENHLERHGSMDWYREAKLRLFRQQDAAKIAVLNSDDPLVRTASEEVKSSVIWFGRTIPAGANGVVIDYAPEEGRDRLWYRFCRDSNGTGALFVDEGIVELADAPLEGLHHRYNFAAAFAAFRIKGGPVAAFERMVSKFRGLSHRTEVVGRWGQRVVINDSKSTTVAATVAAVVSVAAQYPRHGIVVMIGGLVKAGSWDPLFSLVRDESARRIVSVICFGKDGPLLERYAEECGVAVARVDGVADAVRLVMTKDPLAREQGLQEVVLFSPGAASFDEYRSFEERGDRFKDLVRDYLGPADSEISDTLM
jgi:UDP-N-acetylmuramoylalanine--D-glutamate ligase